VLNLLRDRFNMRSEKIYRMHITENSQKINNEKPTSKGSGEKFRKSVKAV